MTLQRGFRLGSAGIVLDLSGWGNAEAEDAVDRLQPLNDQQRGVRLLREQIHVEDRGNDAGVGYVGRVTLNRK